jgi:hypothetical protein
VTYPIGTRELVSTADWRASGRPATLLEFREGETPVLNIGWPVDLSWYKLLTDWGSLIGGSFALIAGAALYIIGRVQANAITKQTDTLKQQVKDAEDTAERQLRAYVGVTSGSVTLELANHSPRLRAMLKMENAGQTPAYKLRGLGGIKTGVMFEDLWLNQTTPFAQNSMLLPNAEFAYRLFLTDFAAPSKGFYHTFVFGRIEYVDAFGKQRWTDFRFTVGGDLSAGPAQLHPCENGNDAN